MQQNNYSENLYNFFIDSHTHLLDYDRQSHLPLTKIIEECKESEVRYIVVNTTCSNQFEAMEDMYNSYKNHLLQPQGLMIVPNFGIHPCYVCEELKKEQNNNQTNQWKQMLKQYLEKYQISNVGQIGLDFRKDVIETNSKEKQWEYFQYQFQLAVQMKRTVTIHCVRAYGQLLKFFKKLNSKYNNKQKLQIAIVLHSYGGSADITKSLLKLENLSLYFSLSLKYSPQILEVIPLEKLILQTDAPYQNNQTILLQTNLWTKQSLDNQTQQYQQFIKNQEDKKVNLLKQCKFFNKSILNNRPKNVLALYKFLAQMYKMEQTQFREMITYNSMKAFRLLKK